MSAEPISRDQILRRERGQGNINISCSAGNEQDWQPYAVDPLHVKNKNNSLNLSLFNTQAIHNIDLWVYDHVAAQEFTGRSTVLYYITVRIFVAAMDK